MKSLLPLDGIYMVEDYQNALVHLAGKIREHLIRLYDRPDMYRFKESVPTSKEIAEEALEWAKRNRG